MAAYHKSRFILRVVALFVLLFAFVITTTVRLFQFQLVEGAANLQRAEKQMSSTITIKAARGEIVDRNGKVLATNEVVYNIVFDRNFMPRTSEISTIYKMIRLMEKQNVEWNDELPITATAPYEFLPDRDNDVATLKSEEKLRLNVYATAQNCMDAAIDKYKIKDVSGIPAAYLRKIIGVRYTMDYKDFSVYNRYTFAENIPAKTVTLLKELSSELPGVSIVEESARVYLSGDIAPQVIGSVGPIYKEEYAELSKKGYKMDSIIGKSGVEQAMETYLRGTDGKMQIIQNESGEIVENRMLVEPVAGNTVMLTLDSDFQAKVQTLLAEHIKKNNADPKVKYQSEGASVVVLDTKTNQMLACVSYPTYDINDYKKDYNKLLKATGKPLNNRALNGIYRPGSTFKTVVGTAALTEGIINPSSEINCTGIYRFYNDYQPGCLRDHHSGYINIFTALQYSCNIFFYDCGRQLGIDRINQYAQLLGLGTSTGLEIGSAVGRLSGAETSAKLGMSWQPNGDTIQAAIGQQNTAVSPLQMAIQASTIANHGTRYEAHVVKSILSYDYATTIKQTETVVASQFDMSDSTYKAISDGMVAAASTITGDYNVTDLPYEVAIKTGTPQTTGDHVNNTFICFAPVENPEIAISCMMEDGANTRQLARQILDAYYQSDSGNTKPQKNDTLLP